MRKAGYLAILLAALLAILTVATIGAQGIASRDPKATAEDHQDMMTQLGIHKLRPGPSGNESAPNHANYDEATANPFPNLPEVLTLKNGCRETARRSCR